MIGKFSDMPAEDSDQHHEPPSPAPRERIGPKLGLEGMTQFLMHIVLKGTMRDGKFADENWTLLDAAGLEKLQDIADTLDFFRIERMHAKIKADEWKNRR